MPSLEGTNPNDRPDHGTRTLVLERSLNASCFNLVARVRYECWLKVLVVFGNVDLSIKLKGCLRRSRDDQNTQSILVVCVQHKYWLKFLIISAMSTE